MQRKWVLVAGALVIGGALIVAGQYAMMRKDTPSPAEQPGPTATAETAQPQAGGPTPAVEASAATSAPHASSDSTSAPRPVAPLPGGTPLARISPEGVAADGDRLHPLASAPAGLVSGVSSELLPEGTRYRINFKPWGYGPASRLGQTLVVTITKYTPVGEAPNLDRLAKVPLLLVMNASDGGDLAAGGHFTGTITFTPQDEQLVPVLAQAKPLTP